MWPTYPLFETGVVSVITGARIRNHRKQSLGQLGSARVVLELFVGSHEDDLSRVLCAPEFSWWADGVTSIPVTTEPKNESFLAPGEVPILFVSAEWFCFRVQSPWYHWPE